MIKPHPITSLDRPEDAARIDNLFSVLFNQAQGKELNFLEFSGAGVWPAAGVLHEKQWTLCYNSTDDEHRVYTKMKGVVKYLVFT